MIERTIYDRLNVDIYTIGYSPEGESIVFVIYSGKEKLYTGVIDSYEKNNENYTKKLLEELEISKIDMLCWSHPDRDHSLGLEKLFGFLEESSVFVIPNNIVAYKDKIENDFSKIWDFIRNEEMFPKEQKKSGYSPVKCRIQYISESAEVCNLPCQFFTYGISKYEFSLKSFLPISHDTYRNQFNNRMIEENGFSVGLMLQLGEFCAVFASDCSDKYIQKIDKTHFSEYCDFLKIPHHGSANSTKILDCFRTAFEQKYYIEAASVTKKTKKLPNNEAVKKYYQYCENILYTNQEEHGDGYGINVVSVDVTDREIQYSYYVKGNAGFIKSSLIN